MKKSTNDDGYKCYAEESLFPTLSSNIVASCDDYLATLDAMQPSAVLYDNINHANSRGLYAYKYLTNLFLSCK